MVKRHATQLVRHCIGGFIALLPNFVVYAVLRILTIAPDYQTVIALLAGGQFAFVVHTFWSYKDRAERKTKLGYFWQWCVFMIGQLGASRLNYYVANEAQWVSSVQDRFNGITQWCLQWLFSTPYDYWSLLLMGYFLALVAGVSVSFPWTNFVSHRNRNSTTTSPDESPES